jgi:hypothetical protein
MPGLVQQLGAALAGRTAQQVELIVAPPTIDPASAAASGGCSDRRVDAICVIAASWFEDYLVLDLPRNATLR